LTLSFSGEVWKAVKETPAFQPFKKNFEDQRSADELGTIEGKWDFQVPVIPSVCSDSIAEERASL
jgi:hypothetical protein